MTVRIFLLFASISGFVAVGMGAFGAHALRGLLSDRLMQVMQTAVQYQFYHTLALLAVALLLRHHTSRLLSGSGVAFATGIILFSGSLYVLALTGEHWLGAITPFGGIAFLTGWFLLALHALSNQRGN
jgi:uncharacterized membrane protein YgdD (TMEM256/DUF423 family)